MSNSSQQKRPPQSFQESQALAQLIAIRQELAQTRERLFTLRAEVDVITGYNQLDQNDSSFHLS